MREVANVRRIAILGPSGVGKTVLARRLADVLGFPVVHLDRLFWRPGWIKPPLDEWRDTCSRQCEGDCWIVEGNYFDVIETRLDRAQFIIILDLPVWNFMPRLIARTLVNLGRVRPDLGQIERVNFGHWLRTMTYMKRNRAKFANLVAECNKRGITVVRLTTRRQVNALIRSYA